MNMHSTVAHYTSEEVINSILNGALESGKPYITMHLSLLTMMNDSGESDYVLNKYFTNSKLKTELKRRWDNDFYPKNKPFIFSTIKTDTRTKNNGSLPMWKMYGNDGKGVLIRFKGESIIRLCEEKRSKAEKCIFEPCRYKSTTEVNDLIKKFNNSNTHTTNSDENDLLFKEILNETCFTKHFSWEYENEWRMVVYKDVPDDIKTKSTQRGIIEYVEFKIPIKYIEEICLGPLSNDNSFESLKLLYDKLVERFSSGEVHFKLAKSKITIK